MVVRSSQTLNPIVFVMLLPVTTLMVAVALF
jgi:hypothetical protein